MSRLQKIVTMVVLPLFIVSIINFFIWGSWVEFFDLTKDGLKKFMFFNLVTFFITGLMLLVNLVFYLINIKFFYKLSGFIAKNYESIINFRFHLNHPNTTWKAKEFKKAKKYYRNASLNNNKIFLNIQNQYNYEVAICKRLVEGKNYYLVFVNKDLYKNRNTFEQSLDEVRSNIIEHYHHSKRNELFFELDPSILKNLSIFKNLNVNFDYDRWTIRLPEYWNKVLSEAELLEVFDNIRKQNLYSTYDDYSIRISNKDVFNQNRGLSSSNIFIGEPQRQFRNI